MALVHPAGLTIDFIPCPPSKRSAVSSGKPTHQRRYAPKTRTGCITCKIRRVKCDEDKPFCARCTSTGRKCDGYGPTEKRCDNTRSPSSEPPSTALVTDCTSDALERRSFAFFRDRTAPFMSGYFQDPVWDRLVLQLSHTEPAVRHAVNAIAALHEEKMLRNRASKEGVNVSLVRTGFPIRQYSKAMSEMQSLVKGDSLNLLLLCALLCAHFECLREWYVSALIHGENAISLVGSSSSIAVQKIDPHLVRAIMQLDLQGTIFLGMRVPGLPFYTDATDSTLPDAFHDLTAARNLVSTWTCRMYHFMRTTADRYKFDEPGNLPLETIAYSHELEKTFQTLDRLVWDFRQTPGLILSNREKYGLEALRSRVKINRILAATCLYSEATMFDAYLADFEEILSICIFIATSDAIDCQMLSVSLDDGVIAQLFFVATHCRESSIRHRALDQLRKLRAHSDSWFVEMTILIIETCITFEEALCPHSSPSCSDIPEWHRIHSAAFEHEELPNAQTRVNILLRTRPNGMDGEWKEFTELTRCVKRRDPMRELQKIFAYKEPQVTQRFISPRIFSWP